MNAFWLSTDPVQAAKDACDQHVCKMPTEYAQMLCTAARALGVEAPYKSSHEKHPCTLWVGRSRDNYRLMIRLFEATCAEYTQRYGKIHKAYIVIFNWFDTQPLSGIEFPEQGLTPLPQTMPELYHDPDPVRAYRNFYIHDKLFARYLHSHPPGWLLLGRIEHGLPTPRVGSSPS